MRPAAVREHRGDVAPHAGDAGALERCVPESALERLRIPVEQRREIRLDNIGAHAELVVARRARELHVPRADVLTHVASEQPRSEEHTSELQSRGHLVCRYLLEKIKM